MKPLSFDHIPTNRCQLSVYIHQFPPVSYFVVERARITAAGGRIENGRTNGMWTVECVLF